MVQDIPAVKDECGFGHAVKYFLEVEVAVEIPLGQQRDRVASLRGQQRILDITDLAPETCQVGTGVPQGLRVGDDDLGLLFE